MKHLQHRWPLDRRQTRWFTALMLLALALLGLNVGINEWANPYYSAGVFAGLDNWRAFFFGSFDPSNAITIDKTPLSGWLMIASAHVFGFNYFAIALPNLLFGLASVALLFFLMRRTFGFGAAMVAGLTLALTPVFVAVFRFNDPDAPLMFFVLAAISAMFTLNRTGHMRWAALLGIFIGLGFMTKMLQAFIILPILAIVYLGWGRPRLAARIWHVLLATITLILSAGWWPLTVGLTPARDRPYIGGTMHNSIWELILGYNGLDRLSGKANTVEQAAVATLQPGLGRLFGTDIGGHIAWLLPMAIITGLVGVYLTHAQRRLDTRFFETLTWLLALLSGAAVFSFMSGIFHQYYTVALAPYIAALTGITYHIARTHVQSKRLRFIFTGAFIITIVLHHILLSKAVGLEPLAWIITLTGLGACVLLLTHGTRHTLTRLTITLIVATLSLGQVAYDITTVQSAQLASVPVAGPPVAYRFHVPGAAGEAADEIKLKNLPTLRTIPGTTDTLYAYIAAGGRGYRWSAAVPTGLQAAHMQLGIREPVFELGGYAAKDPYPTLAKFQQLVKSKQIRYYATASMAVIYRNMRLTQEQHVQVWVQEHYAPTIIAGVRVYDLQTPAR